MSDLLQSIGMTFDTVASGAGDAMTSFLSDAAKAFDTGTTDPSAASATDSLPAATPPVDTAPVDTTGAETTPVPTPVPATDPNATSAFSSPADANAYSAEMGGSPPPGIIGSALNWYKGLSPGAQMILASGVAGGGKALMQTLAQRAIMEQNQQNLDRNRGDVIRRGYVAPIGEGAFSPRNGIINGARGQ